MANTHTLLSQHHWKGVELAELVRRQLVPNGTDANTTISGPKVVLSVRAAQVLAMVLHELVTMPLNTAGFRPHMDAWK
jgi:two-component sensor histidine kinase